MGDQWEARVSAMENTQEKLEHNIREMEGQLARLTSLFEDMAVRPRGLSPLPNQQVPRPFVQTTNHSPREARRPNLQQQYPRLRLLLWQHLDLPISQTAQRANLVDERLIRTSSNRTISPSPTLSCSQS